MADAVTFDEIMRRASDAGYKLTLNKETGKVHMDWPAKRNPAFEKFVRTNKDILETGFKTPQVLKDSLRDAGAFAWVSALNHKINEYRDRYAAPAIGSIGEGAGEMLNQVLNKPFHNASPAEQQEFGEGVAKTFVPDSITGKAVNASMLAAPESRMARMAIPLIVGGVTGYTTGEGGISGALQGAGAAIAGEIPGLPGQAKATKNYFKREELQYRLDDTVPGEKLSPVLRLKSFDELRQRYGNWVRALRDARPGREAGQRYADGIDSLAEAVNSYALSTAKQLRDDFMNKMKVPFNKAKGFSKELHEEYKSVREQVRQTLADARRLTGAMRGMRRLRTAVYDTAGRMKGTPSAVDAQKEYELTKSAIRDKLKSYNPAFKGTYDALNEEYALFAGLRHIADNKSAIQDVTGHVDLDAINHELDLNPRRYQSRIGEDNWDSVKSLFRRQASDAPNYKAGETYFDQPGELGKLRAIMYGPRGHVATSAETVGNIAGGAPLVGRPVGMAKPPKVVPPTIPRLITGAGANEAIDYGREPSAP